MWLGCHADERSWWWQYGGGEQGHCQAAADGGGEEDGAPGVGSHGRGRRPHRRLDRPRGGSAGGGHAACWSRLQASSSPPTHPPDTEWIAVDGFTPKTVHTMALPCTYCTTLGLLPVAQLSIQRLPFKTRVQSNRKVSIVLVLPVGVVVMRTSATL